jgi:O-antigen/teichoic acid export membrane protein
MSREETLFKNTALYLAGSFASKLLGFILLPLYTHYLSPYHYGYFDLINTTLLLLLPLVTLEINDGLYRYLLDAPNSMERARVITATLTSTGRNILVFLVIFFIITNIFTIQYAFLILLALVTSIISDTWQQIARGLKHNTLFSISGVIYAFTLFIFNIVLIAFWQMKIDGLLYSNIAAGLATFCFIEGKLKILRTLKLTSEVKLFRNNLIRFSLPLMPNAMNWWLISLCSRYLITFYMGTAANGIYAVANKFPSIIILIDTIFNLAWQESAITEYNSADKNIFYTKMFNFYMKAQLSVMLVLIPATKILMGYMVDPSFYIAWRYTPLLYACAVFTSFSTFYGTAYIVSKETRGSLITSLICLITNLILSIALIPLLGLQGAALSITFSFLVMWILRYREIKKYFIITIDLKTFLLLFSMMVIFIMLLFIDSRLLDYALMVLGFIISVIVNAEMLDLIRRFVVRKYKASNLFKKYNTATK